MLHQESASALDLPSKKTAQPGSARVMRPDSKGKRRGIGGMGVGWLCGLALLVLMTGCQADQEPLTLDDVARTFESGDYELAYRQARAVSSRASGESKAQADYLGGMSAREMGDDRRAVRLLENADVMVYYWVKSEIYAILGLVYSEMENYEAAADRFSRAAPYLQGQDQANAYFYAGVALQKLGRDPEAVTSFRLAQAGSQDPTFLAEIDSRLSTTGYTLQFGAFTNPENARREAQRVAQAAANLSVGSPTIVQAIDQTSGNPVTLVQLGLFTDYRSAQQARNDLGEPTVMIIRRDGVTR